jgi:hypothetical protein
MEGKTEGSYISCLPLTGESEPVRNESESTTSVHSYTIKLLGQSVSITVRRNYSL